MLSQLLPVNEIFETIQGEATHAGRPSVFVRLQGCPVGCAWCDTKHTWFTDELQQVSRVVMLSKTGEPKSTYALMTVVQVLAAVAVNEARHVVLTGGEPCMYNLVQLTRDLLQGGYSVQVETSGTYPIHVHTGTWLTVSPKLKKPGKKHVMPDAVARASEIKLPVAIQRDVDDFDEYVQGLDPASRPHARGIPIWLQPVWQTPHGQDVCVKVATERGWRVSLQTHKFAGLR